MLASNRDILSTKRHKKVTTTLMTAFVAITVGACSSGNANVNLAETHSGAPTNTVQRSGDDSLRVLADRMADTGDYAAAIPLYRHLLRKDNGDASTHTSLGMALLAMGNHSEAQKSLTIAVKKGADGEARYGLGKIALALGNYGDAAAQFGVASSNMIGDPRPYSGRGIALAALGQFDQAILAFDKGLYQNPKNNEALSNKALTLTLLGSSDVAVEMLEEVTRSGAAGPRDRQNLALAYLMSGRRSDAVSMARVDMDAQSVDDTLMFYEELGALPMNDRMAALVTGTIAPAQNREETGNLELVDNDAKRMAASRLTAVEPDPVVEPEPVIEPEPEPEVDLTTLPPLVEPTGWALQIGAYRNIPNLMRGMQILYENNDDIIGHIAPRRSEVEFSTNKVEGPKGFYYRLNAGPLKDYRLAKEICDELKVRGTDCWVRPPESSEGKVK